MSIATIEIQPRIADVEFSNDSFSVHLQDGRVVADRHSKQRIKTFFGTMAQSKNHIEIKNPRLTLGFIISASHSLSLPPLSDSPTRSHPPGHSPNIRRARRAA